jgi:hypothetical protein
LMKVVWIMLLTFQTVDISCSSYILEESCVMNYKNKNMQKK